MGEPSTKPRLVAESWDPDEPWWCTCPEAEGPHVHCPWGGGHIHLVDVETGRSLEHPRTERSGG